MPIETTPTRYYLISFDEDGTERMEQDRRLSDDVVRETAEEPVTDVILLSHGWNGDLADAREQYQRWIDAMLGCAQDRHAVVDAVPDFNPLIVGLHWPSKAWGEEDLAAEPVSFAVAPAQTAAESSSIDTVVEEYAVRLADTPTAREAIRTIVQAALVDIAPPTLPPSVRAAYEILDAETNLPAMGAGADPGADREPFDPEVTYQAAQLEEQLVEFGVGGFLGGLLAPLRTLTFWQMKRRACRFGETGGAELLRRLHQAGTGERRVRLHLMGHSFGCIVVSACIAGPPGARPVPVDSLTLVQGAMSLWSYCSAIPVLPDRHGYFHRLVSDQLVDGPMIVTTSKYDRAVGSFYPLGAGVAQQVDYGPGGLPKYGGLGTFGARGPMTAVDDLDVRSAGASYDFRRGVVYNVDCSSVIAQGGGASGAHSDICHPEIAHLMWSGMRSAMAPLAGDDMGT